MTTTVYVALDDRMVADLVSDHLERSGFAVSRHPGAAGSRWPREAGVVLMDLSDDRPLDVVLREVLAVGAKAIVLDVDASPETMMRCLLSGASGYVLLQEVEPDQLVRSVRQVAGGGAALHPGAAAVVLQQWRALRGEPDALRPQAALTDREREVLRAFADGLATKAVATRLGVAAKTVENHKTRIFTKLGARNQAHAVGIAVEHGLLVEHEPA